MEKSLTINSPYTQRFLAWAAERFPFANLISAALGFSVIAAVARQTLIEPLSFSWKDILGVLAYTGQLLLLRILDEFKDYQTDLVAHPNRVIQRGLFRLEELKPWAAISIALGIIWSVAVDQGIGPTLLCWFATILFTIFMSKEFFIGASLRKNIFLYGVSHSLVSGFITAWLFTGTRGVFGFDDSHSITLVISLAVAMSYEITRKTFGSEEERPHLDSYSKELGPVASFALASIYNLIIFVGYAGLYYGMGKQAWWPYLGFLIAYSCTFYPSLNMLKVQNGSA